MNIGEVLLDYSDQLISLISVIKQNNLYSLKVYKILNDMTIVLNELISIYLIENKN